MAPKPNYTGLDKAHLKEVYRYDGPLDEDFFKNNVWWWKLFDTFKEDYRNKSGPLIDWVDRVSSRFQETDFEVEKEDQIYELGEPIEDNNDEQARNWRIKKYFYSLCYLEQDSLYHLKEVAAYELQARITGKYKSGKNWLDLGQENKDSGEDIVNFLKIDIPNRFIELSKIGKSDDLELDLKESDNVLIKQFKKWLGKQRDKRGVPSKPRNKGKSNRLMPWKDIENIDKKKYILPGGDLNPNQMRLINRKVKEHHKDNSW